MTHAPTDDPEGTDGAATPAATAPVASTGVRRLWREHRVLVIAVLAAVVLVAAVTTVLLRTVFAIPVLDRPALQEGVRGVLTDDFRMRRVEDVSCPDKQRIETGNTFTCEVTVSGERRRLRVEVTNESGEYRVNQPQ